MVGGLFCRVGLAAHQSGAVSIRSMRVESSAGAFELFTRFDTGHFCKSRSSPGGLRYSTSLAPKPRFELFLSQ